MGIKKHWALANYSAGIIGKISGTSHMHDIKETLSTLGSSSKQ